MPPSIWENTVKPDKGKQICHGGECFFLLSTFLLLFHLSVFTLTFFTPFFQLCLGQGFVPMELPFCTCSTKTASLLLFRLSCASLHATSRLMVLWFGKGLISQSLTRFGRLFFQCWFCFHQCKKPRTVFLVFSFNVSPFFFPLVFVCLFICLRFVVLFVLWFLFVFNHQQGPFDRLEH